jgi:hypothetical protein
MVMNLIFVKKKRKEDELQTHMRNANCLRIYGPANMRNSGYIFGFETRNPRLSCTFRFDRQ